jgi:UDP-N-acetylmuramate dehydrogenase
MAVLLMSHSLTRYSLKSLNTFGVDANARRLLFIDDEQALLCWVKENNNHEPVLVLGSGSNVLFVGDFSGTVLVNRITGQHLLADDEHSVLVCVGGGECWDHFVEASIAAGWFGLENLSGIPGTVGAAPVQNIGAYGVELQSVFHSLRAIDLDSGCVQQFNREQCQFGYRESVFKQTSRHRWMITSVTFRLSKVFVPNLSYRALADHFSGHVLSAQALRDYVIKIRSEKLPDPKVVGNAGSFFKNPIICSGDFQSLKKRFPTIPHYPQRHDEVKVAAGWLIEQCGLKGFRENDAGMHDRQALVLVNHGEASGQALFDMAMFVANKVWEKFSITLEIEPFVVGGDEGKMQ